MCEVSVVVHDWGQTLTRQMYKKMLNSKTFFNFFLKFLKLTSFTKNFIFFVAFAYGVKNLKVVCSSNKIIGIVTFTNK